jgi:hypothetical protein
MIIRLLYYRPLVIMKDGLEGKSDNTTGASDKALIISSVPCYITFNDAAPK